MRLLFYANSGGTTVAHLLQTNLVVEQVYVWSGWVVLDEGQELRAQTQVVPIDLVVSGLRLAIAA